MRGDADGRCPGSGVFRVVRREGGDESFPASLADAGVDSLGVRAPTGTTSWSRCARDLAPAKVAVVQRAVADVRRRIRDGAGGRGEVVLRLPVGGSVLSEATGSSRWRVCHLEEPQPASWLEDISHRLR